MSVRAKLLVLITLVGFGPLAVLSVTTLRAHQEEVAHHVLERQRTIVEQGSSQTDAYLASIQRQLSGVVTGTIRWDELTHNERVGALWMVLRQMDDASVVALLDHEGRQVVPAAYFSEENPDPDHRDRRLLDPAQLKTIIAGAEVAAAKRDETKLGRPLLLGDSGALVPVTLGVAAPEGSWVVVVGLSLTRLCQQLCAQATVSLEIMLVDDRQTPLCGAGESRHQPLLAAISEAQSTSRFRDASGKEMLASRASTTHGWLVATQQPAEIVLQASAGLKAHALLWIVLSALVALAVGMYLASDLTRPIARLAEAARQLSCGNFEYRVALEQSDELGGLARAFDKMGEEIQARDKEITGWNAELRQRVEERTRELQEAHRSLERSQRVAVMSSFGSGIAQEIGNPLTSVLGFNQLLHARISKDPTRQREAEMLGRTCEEALRIRAVVKRLSSLSQRLSDDHLEALNLHRVLDAARGIVVDAAAEVGAVIECEYGEETPIVRGNFTKLQQAIMQLLFNAVDATGEGGRILVATSCLGGQVRVHIRDNGVGIAPELQEQIFEPFFTTKVGQEGDGLGLTLAQRVFEEHGGSVDASSALDEGTTMTVTMELVQPSEEGAPDSTAELDDETSGVSIVPPGMPGEPCHV